MKFIEKICRTAFGPKGQLSWDSMDETNRESNEASHRMRLDAYLDPKDRKPPMTNEELLEQRKKFLAEAEARLTVRYDNAIASVKAVLGQEIEALEKRIVEQDEKEKIFNHDISVLIALLKDSGMTESAIALRRRLSLPTEDTSTPSKKTELNKYGR